MNVTTKLFHCQEADFLKNLRRFHAIRFFFIRFSPTLFPKSMPRFLFCHKPLYALLLSFVAVFTLGLHSCQNPSNPNSDAGSNVVLFNNGIISNATYNQDAFNLGLNDFLYGMMRDIYFWNDKVPTGLNAQRFSTPEDLMKSLIYTPEDRFTFIEKNGQALFAQVQQNQQTVFGFVPVLLSDTTVMVAKVIPNAPAGVAGLQRGMRILRINGTAVNRSNYTNLTTPNSMTMEVLNANGSTQSLTMTRTTVNAKTVLKYDVLTAGGTKVAYMNYDTFLGTTDEVNEAFAFFRQQGATELVLDLRYNLGGLNSNAQHLASLVASRLSGKVLMRQRFNTRYTANDQTTSFVTLPNAMDVQRVFVIISYNTASASELVINSLRPFMPVILVGTPSRGKNVGSLIMLHPPSGYAVAPTCFTFENSNGERDFGNGFTPTRPEVDDVTRDFGDPQEKCLAAALSFIQRGVFPKQALASIADVPQYELLREQGDRGVLPTIVTTEDFFKKTKK
jgi:C-terminal processing protease CtpA/Prc